MPLLKTMRILNDIYAVFNERDFDLRTNRKQREKNLDKLQICININGTATVVIPRQYGGGVYMTFEGYGRIDLWDGLRSSCFDIERDKYSPEEIRKQFHEEMAADYGLEFRNGGHQLYSPDWPGRLFSARIIPQVYKVFHDGDFYLPQSNDPDRLSLKKRFDGYVEQDGKLVIRAWIEDRWERWRIHHIDIVFDGSDTVTVAKYPYHNGQQILIDEARNILECTYGVSFEAPSLPDLKEIYNRVRLEDLAAE